MTSQKTPNIVITSFIRVDGERQARYAAEETFRKVQAMETPDPTIVPHAASLQTSKRHPYIIPRTVAVNVEEPPPIRNCKKDCDLVTQIKLVRCQRLPSSGQATFRRFAPPPRFFTDELNDVSRDPTQNLFFQNVVHFDPQCVCSYYCHMTACPSHRKPLDRTNLTRKHHCRLHVLLPWGQCSKEKPLGGEENKMAEYNELRGIIDDINGQIDASRERLRLIKYEHNETHPDQESVQSDGSMTGSAQWSRSLDRNKNTWIRLGLRSYQLSDVFLIWSSLGLEGRVKCREIQRLPDMFGPKDFR
ncbi:hypothetical protein Bbelb_432410 [Branchiostoma belcheri]|nr:hypothetical protein Bbelb_432410 [Branchiostoma belcheri]